MEAILPLKIKNEQKFFDSALKVGYNEMEIHKFIYVMQQSDLDIFPKMHDERINVLIYGWELCEDYKQKLNPNEWELPEEMEVILKHLVPWSLDIWFSKEWDKCKLHLKNGLIHCLNRARDLLMRMPDMMQINWDFLLLYNLKPWQVMYLKNLQVTKEKTLENGAQSIETEELPATEDDIAYVKLEQLPLIVLRLIKIFDQSSIDMVKTLCMRVIAAWNKIHQRELEASGSRRPYIPPEDKRCLLLICHIYLMAVYESDDVKGYVIDNMINNIRFYYQGFQNSTALYVMDNLEYTPARFIALTNMHLRVQKRDFFDFFIWNKYDTSLVNLFGVVSQAYKSYLLGNLLMELNNMNEDDFASNIPLYKRLMNSYVNEREKSELFLLNELEKLENQRYAHNIIQTVKHVTDFKSKICKGNRMSNIGNYENSDDAATPLDDVNHETKVEQQIKEEVRSIAGGEDDDDEQERVRIKESELRLDPVFQNLPNNKSILYYVYDVLAKKDYNGWHFAKVVLLVKIIDHELNMIETWRYHPGLTTDFMLNLEVKLSHHYVDLAKIFKDHPFIEQEFWLTAFYLNPTTELYETIKRLGMRNNRKRTDEQTKLVMTVDNIEAKYGLLSSTIDVKEIATLANTEDPETDYNPLYSALHSLRVPDSLVKDMITAIFLPRNKLFAWVVDWGVLRTRCKMIMNSSKEKKRFVELNMAEANDRLKYLIIDYEKYKNRPQLDYGTIEEGYENLMTTGDFDKDTDEEEEEEEEEEDFEDDEDIYESKRRGRPSLAAAARKKEQEKVVDDNSQEDDPFLMGKRRTRARTAATLASFLFQTLPRASRRKRNQKEEEPKANEEKSTTDNDDKSSDSKSPITTTESPVPSPLPAASGPEGEPKDSQDSIVATRNIKECLKERPQFLNSTQGFNNLIDIWNVEKSDLQTIDENCVSLMESSAVLQRALKWKQLNKEINPLGCDEQEYIDDCEMVIHNAEFAAKMEYNFSAIKVEPEEKSDEVEEVRNEEPVTSMEVVEKNADVVTSESSKDDAFAKNAEKSETVTKKLQVEEANKSIETEQNKEILSTEENSNESINSDVSTAALKDSGEVSESNTEANSKRNSINNDIEMDNEVKIITSSDVQKDIITDQKENTKTENKQDSKMKDQQLDEKSKNKTTQSNTENTPINDANKKVELETKNKTIYSDSTEEDLTENKDSTSENSKHQTKEYECDKLDKDSKQETVALGSEDVCKKLEKLEEKSSAENKEIQNNKILESRTDSPEKGETYLKTDDIDDRTKQKDEQKVEDKTKDKENKEIEKTDKDPKVDTKDEENKNPDKKENETSQDIICNISETPDKKEDSDTLKISPSNDNESQQSLCEESNLVLHYSSSEENAIESTEKILIQFCDVEKDLPSPVNSSKTEESTDGETRNLKNLCLTKKVKVLVKKLRPADLTNLRQPKVKVRRIDYEKYLEGTRAKRRRLAGRAYVDIDDSSNSANSYGNNSSSSDVYHPVKVKRKIPVRRHSMRHLRTSESDNDSNNSEDCKLSTIRTKVRRLSTPSTSQSSSQHVSGPKSTRQTTGPKSSKQNLVVTPRSASGLKLRISNAEQGSDGKRTRSSAAAAPVVYDDVIQLSSSSSDACILNDLSAIEEVIEVDDNPLFEEEILI